MTDKPTPLSGFPELLPEHRAVERQVIASLSRSFELHGFANIETRAVEPIDRLSKGGEIDKEIYVLRRLQADDTARRLGARAPLRPHRAVRALRPRAQRQARVPVPALPDPAGLARRATAGGPLPPVHPGRHRRGRPRRAAVPPRRRGGAGDGRGARRAAAAEPLLPGQQPQADPGLLPRPRHPRRHRRDPADRQARQAAGRGGRRAAGAGGRRHRGAGAALHRARDDPGLRHLASSSGSGPWASRTSCSTRG